MKAIGQKFADFGKEVRRHWVLFLMLLPATIFFIVFCYIPMPGAYIAFVDYSMGKGIFGSPFVGLRNFEFLIRSGDLWRITKNTVLYNLVFIFLGNFLQLFFAIAISEVASKWYKKFTQSVTLLPNFISFVIVGYFAYNLFNYDYGFINTIRNSLGMSSHEFYSDQGIWKYITFGGLLIMSMAGYVLNRSDFKYRSGFSFFMYFTTLFSGGLVPTYILMVKHLGMKDNILAMVLPGLCSAWSIFLMRNFLKSIPDSLYEAAIVDGAGDFRIYWQVILPVAVPSLATVGLFTALGYWNEWYNAMLYIQTPSKWPLQYFLKRIVDQANIQVLIAQGVQVETNNLPSESIKMATAVVSIGPIILLYPFVQRYFVAGLTIGSVKG